MRYTLLIETEASFTSIVGVVVLGVDAFGFAFVTFGAGASFAFFVSVG